MESNKQAVLSVVVLNCGYTAPSIQEEKGHYHNIFETLLKPAVERACARSTLRRTVKLEITGWDAVNQVYPASLEGINAIIVSGSPNGAYQDLDWIHALNKFITDVYHNHPSIKLYGSCFGHQIICHALLRDQGVVAKKDPAGWELGVHKVQIERQFAENFPTLNLSRPLRLQFLHGDHVFIPDGAMPDGFYMVGSTSHCLVQGIYQPGRILTYQGHPEFDQFIETECLKLVSKRVGWEDEFTRVAMESAEKEDDAAIAADTIVEFFLEPEATKK